MARRGIDPRGLVDEVFKGVIKDMDKEARNNLAGVPSDPAKRQVGGDHYLCLKIQPTEYIIANELDFCEGNVVKYVTRHEDKGGAEDIEKAIQYLELILKYKYGNKRDGSRIY